MDLERAGDAVRIVGGKEAAKHKHPWQAVSFKLNLNLSPSGFQVFLDSNEINDCGGSLISK